MNPYNLFKHITNESELIAWITEEEEEKFIKSLEPTALQSFEININRIFKDALNALNTLCQ